MVKRNYDQMARLLQHISLPADKLCLYSKLLMPTADENQIFGLFTNYADKQEQLKNILPQTCHVVAYIIRWKTANWAVVPQSLNSTT